LAILAAALILARPVRAADIVWTNLAGGNWSVAANWNPNQVPGAGDTAYLTNSGTYAVTNNGTRTIGGLVVGGDSGTQTLAQVGSYTLTLNGAGRLGANGRFLLNLGTFTGTNVVPNLAAQPPAALVCWPAELAGWQLYAATNLNAPQWLPLPDATNRWFEPVMAPQKFFRLGQP
jgi:hypothetical protein